MTKDNPWKYLFKGIISAVLYGLTLILLPLVLLDLLAANVPPEYFTLEPEMTFWIVAMGMVVIAFAFGRESSPKRTVRRAIFNGLLTIANVFYVYSYWLSGVANIDLSIPLPIPGFEGILLGIQLDLGGVIALELGVIGLKFLIIVYDLIDSIVYLSKRKRTKMKISPGEEESDTFATYLEEGGQ